MLDAILAGVPGSEEAIATFFMPAGYVLSEEEWQNFRRKTTLELRELRRISDPVLQRAMQRLEPKPGITRVAGNILLGFIADAIAAGYNARLEATKSTEPRSSGPAVELEWLLKEDEQIVLGLVVTNTLGQLLIALKAERGSTGFQVRQFMSEAVGHGWNARLAKE